MTSNPEQRSTQRHSTPRSLATKYRRAFAICAQPPPSDLATARALLLDCVLGDPGNLIFAESFLQVLQRANPQKGRWRGFWDRVAFERAYRAGEWTQAITRGLRLLVVRPSDGLILCGLAEAHQKLGFREVGLLFWSTVDAVHPNDPKLQRRCALAFMAMGMFEQACTCWQRLSVQLPHDREAPEMLRRLQAPQQPAMDVRSPVESPIDNKQHLLDESDSLRQNGDLSAACELLRLALQTSPGDLQIAEKLEDLELDSGNHRIHLARQGPESPDDLLIADLQADLVRREIDVFAARAARYPLEHQRKLRLADSLKHGGNFDEASRILSTIPPGSVSERDVHLQWGECLQHQRRFDEALAHYELAAKEALSGGPLQLADKLALYRTGVLALHMGDLSKAQHYLRPVAESSPDYKDTQQHLDKIDSIRHKDGFSPGQ